MYVEVIAQGIANPDSKLSPLLIEYNDFEELEAALESDPTVESYEPVNRNKQTGIYYIEYTEKTKFISTIITEVNGFLLHTETKDRG